MVGHPDGRLPGQRLDDPADHVGSLPVSAWVAMNSVSGSAASKPGAAARRGPPSLDFGTFDPRRTLRFIRIGLALLVALVVLVSGLVLWRAWLTQMAEAETQVQTTARIIERSTSATLDKVRIALSSASDQFEAQLAGAGVDPNSVWAIVDKAAAHAREIQRIVVFDRNGKQICGQPIEQCLNLNVSVCRSHLDGKRRLLGVDQLSSLASSDAAAARRSCGSGGSAAARARP